MNREQHIYAIGCLACRRRRIRFQPCQVHHLNLDGKAGQKRRGQRVSIGLCPWHHQGQPPAGCDERRARLIFGPSLALHSRAFRLEFGSDDDLLAEEERLIEERKAA